MSSSTGCCCIGMLYSGLVLAVTLSTVQPSTNKDAPPPILDPATQLRNILVPADVAVGSVIYRLRASDPLHFDYPLAFWIRDPTATVSVVGLNCTRFNSVCQANVVVQKRLEAGRYYDFLLEVATHHTHRAIHHNCSLRATNAVTPLAQTFPGAPSLLSVSENTRRNTEVGVIRARGADRTLVRHNRPILLELWGGAQFGLRQHLVNGARDAEGAVVLVAPLDYETTAVHHLVLLANDPWTDRTIDTRNIASWPLLVAVLDEQDTPPVFTQAPPTTVIDEQLAVGELVAQVQAEDGDKGKPREIRYYLTPESQYFNISEATGEIRLIQPLSTLISSTMQQTQPILLTVTAEEIRSAVDQAPSQTTSIQLALLLPPINSPNETRNVALQPLSAPQFDLPEYSAILEENSPMGTILELGPQTQIFVPEGYIARLSARADCNGTFDVTPSVIEGGSGASQPVGFTVHVRDSALLDYERWHSLGCHLDVTLVGAALSNYTDATQLKVLLSDTNDNAPQFTKTHYRGAVIEGAATGTSVLQVQAVDADREPGNTIKYVRLVGEGAGYFRVHPTTGEITTVGGATPPIDAETNAVLEFSVEAADENGYGRKSSASVTIDVMDVNDVAPRFERPIYEFIFKPDRSEFTTTPAVIRATDGDLTSPNNEVHYELILPASVPSRLLRINELSGEITVGVDVGTVSEFGDVTEIVARAWDGGVPRLSGECLVRIYSADSSGRRKMTFILPGSGVGVNTDLNQQQVIRHTLEALSGGGQVHIDEPDAIDVSRPEDRDRMLVIATITNYRDAIVDVDRIRTILDRERERNQFTAVTSERNRTNNNDLWWILLLLILLVLLLVAVALVICCVCEMCPLYVPPKRRPSRHNRISAVVVEDAATTMRRNVAVEATPGPGPAPAPPQQTWSPLHRTRDQIYIREGNTDILRLVTRPPASLDGAGNTDEADMELIDDGERGKHILLKRFIEQQQGVLEAASLLRQQANAMLEHRLETQSLPAGTQTENDAQTQTDPMWRRRRRRRIAQSDDDTVAAVPAFSDYYNSDGEATNLRQQRRKRTRRRRIRTPIEEDVELEVVEQRRRGESLSDDDDDDLERFFDESPSMRRSLRSQSVSRIPVLVRPNATVRKSYSHTDLRLPSQTSARYMDWYGRQKITGDYRQRSAAADAAILDVDRRKTRSFRRNTDRHPLMQHSARQFEAVLLPTKPNSEQRGVTSDLEEAQNDTDSGIALVKPAITQKKSVFTIAYDDVHTKKIAADTDG